MHEHTGHNNPTALITTTTPIGVTLLSAVGDDCTTLAALRDATPEAKQLRLNHQCWLMRMVADRGLRSRLQLAMPTVYAGRLRRLVMLAGYAGKLGRLICWLFTTTGYVSWLRRLVKVIMN